MQKLVFVCILPLFLLTACAGDKVVNEAGRQSKYVDYRTADSSTGVGIESQDIVSMTDKMVRSMLSNPQLMNRDRPPRVLVEGSMFYNESTSRLNKKLITSRLRVELNRAANGKLVFVSRRHLQSIKDERDLKREQLVDKGTIRTTLATAGVDYSLGGTILSLDTLNKTSGSKSRYHDIVFEMIDMELGTIVWTDNFTLKKEGTDDAVYR